MAISACDAGHSEAPSGARAFELTDSAGVTLAIASSFLDQVSGMKALEDGGVVLVNAGTQEMRFFDREGRLLRTAGRLGEGPATTILAFPDMQRHVGAAARRNRYGMVRVINPFLETG